jgi:peptidoglycan hydrolase-like protein with peptidoglycan-binding domain
VIFLRCRLPLSKCLTRNLFSILCCLLLICSAASALTHHARKHTGASLNASGHSRSRVRSARTKSAGKVRTVRSRGQQGIDNDRALQIQQALIDHKYLGGEPSGEWDQATRDAMTRFQADNGWQTKNVPDARALIKLGLGPNHDGILNPDTAAIVNPALVDNRRMPTPGGAAMNNAF